MCNDMFNDMFNEMINAFGLGCMEPKKELVFGIFSLCFITSPDFMKCIEWLLTRENVTNSL